MRIPKLFLHVIFWLCIILFGYLTLPTIVSKSIWLPIALGLGLIVIGIFMSLFVHKSIKNVYHFTLAMITWLAISAGGGTVAHFVEKSKNPIIIAVVCFFIILLSLLGTHFVFNHAIEEKGYS